MRSRLPRKPRHLLTPYARQQLGGCLVAYLYGLTFATALLAWWLQ